MTRSLHCICASFVCALTPLSLSPLPHLLCFSLNVGSLSQKNDYGYGDSYGKKDSYGYQDKHSKVIYFTHNQHTHTHTHTTPSLLGCMCVSFVLSPYN